MGFSSFDRGTSEFFEGKAVFFNELKACAKWNEIRIFLLFKSYKLDSLTDAQFIEDAPGGYDLTILAVFLDDITILAEKIDDITIL